MTTETIQRTNIKPWYAGMKNLIGRELYHERSRMYWIQQILVWTIISDGMVLLFLTLPTGMVEGAVPAYILSLVIFYSMLTFVISIFIPVLLQGVIIDDKVSGTTAWILSKPVSKKAYLVSKLAASILAIIMVSVVISGFIGYGIFYAFGYTLNITGFIINLGLTGIVVVYFACLTVMFGTITTSRGKVLAAAVGIGIGAQFLARYFPLIIFLVPYSLPVLGLGFVTGDPVQGIELMLISAIIQIVMFTIAALFVFDRTEL